MQVPRKRIIFVIVEGPSDEDALGVILSKIYDKSKVYLHVIRGDITTQSNVDSGNIVAHIGDIIRKYAKDNHFKKTDFWKVIHIVDMDGAYISDDYILEDGTVKKVQYSETSIKVISKSAIMQRNRKKRENLDKLCITKRIWDVPYQVFYMSCNLDHVLYDKLNSSDEEKEYDSYHFAKRYRNDITAFWAFVSSSDFSVMIEYQDSWKYIKDKLHSLERHSNLGLCFVEEFVQDI